MEASFRGGSYLVLTFPSTHQALKFERLVKDSGQECQLMPVPRQISSSCGLAAKVEHLGLKQLLAQIQRLNIEYDAVYKFQNGAQPKCLIKYEE